MKRGFSLIQVSILLVIAGLVATTMLSPSTNSRDAKAKLTNSRLDKIERAIINYKKNSGDIPCPADITLANTAANQYYAASKETADGTCLGLINPSGVYIGTVPVRTLGLPDNYMFDGWGNRFTYVIESVAATKSNWTAGGNMAACDGSFSLNGSNAGWTLRTTGTNTAGAIPLTGYTDAQTICPLTAAVASGDVLEVAFNATSVTSTSITVCTSTAGAAPVTCTADTSGGVTADSNNRVVVRIPITTSGSYVAIISNGTVGQNATIDNVQINKVNVLKNAPVTANVLIYDTSDTSGTILNDVDAADLLNHSTARGAMYVLVSYGYNGAGAYSQVGVQNSTTGASDYELENTDLSTDGIFRYGVTNYNSGTNYFDDFVRWKDYDDIMAVQIN